MQRFRRLRSGEAMRRMVRETRLDAAAFISLTCSSDVTIGSICIVASQPNFSFNSLKNFSVITMS